MFYILNTMEVEHECGTCRAVYPQSLTKNTDVDQFTQYEEIRKSSRVRKCTPNCPKWTQVSSSRYPDAISNHLACRSYVWESLRHSLSIPLQKSMYTRQFFLDHHLWSHMRWPDSWHFLFSHQHQLFSSLPKYCL